MDVTILSPAPPSKTQVLLILDDVGLLDSINIPTSQRPYCGVFAERGREGVTLQPFRSLVYEFYHERIGKSHQSFQPASADEDASQVESLAQLRMAAR